MHLVQHDIGRGVTRRAGPQRSLQRRLMRRNTRLQRLRGVVAQVHRVRPVRVAHLIAMVFCTENEVPDDFARPRVEQQFVRIEAMALPR